MPNIEVNKMIKVFLLGALFFIYTSCFTQNSIKNNRNNSSNDPELLINYAVSLNSLATSKSYLKSLQLVQSENWDSVIVQTNKSLLVEKNQQLKDILNYYRADAFIHLGLYFQAEKCLFKIQPSFKYYFNVEICLAEICIHREQFKEAIRRFNKVDVKNFFQKKNISLTSYYHNVGNCHFHLQQYNEAEEYIKKTISLLGSDSALYVDEYTELANIYYDQYIDDKAIFYFTKAYNLAKKYGDFKLKESTAGNMAVVEENRKNANLALKYRKEFEAWHDSLNDQNQIYEVAQVEKKHAVDEKQRQVKLLKTENALKETQRKMYFYIVLFLALILSLGIYFYRLNVKRSKIIFKQKKELDILNASKDKLFSIVSHDLRSSVQALQISNTNLKYNLKAYDEQFSDQELNKQIENNSILVSNTYNILDNLLNWVMLQNEGGYFHQESQPLKVVIDQVAYNFQGLLNQNEITFENNLPRSVKVFIDKESMKIVFRNFMDNCIKFSDPKSKITVSLKEENENEVTIIWEDTGKGMNEETRLKLISNSIQLMTKEHEDKIGSGLGMRLCKSMIEKNGGFLNIESEIGVGTKMMITFQKNSHS
jgi:signal transduction histidine kinase